MSCADTGPLISRLLDGELAPSEQAEVERHLLCCESCRLTYRDWKSQGTLLRGFFASAALDETFVQKAGAAARAAAVPKARSFRAPLWRWAPAIAAAVVVAFLVVQFFPGVERNSLGKVINAGDGLEVRSSGSPEWSAASAGALIRTGDWVRNPESSPAEILLLNTFRLTLHKGALAEVGADGSGSAGTLALLRGTLSSEADAASDLRVRTAAGTVTARGASFDMHLDHVALPNLLMADDRSEVLSATVLPVGGVRIGAGSVRLESEGGAREVGAGNSAYFTPTQLAVVPEPAGASSGIAASLQPDRGRASRSGLLKSSMVASESGLVVQIRADGVPLKRLLETATGETVSGAGDIRVTGSLAYPVQSSDESLVAAIGNQLGLTIAVARQNVSSKTASLGEGKIRLVSEIDARPEYSVRKSPAGALTFSFRGVSAGRVFHELRSESVDLPLLSEDDSWVPVTVEASDIEPARVGEFLEKELGLVVRDGSTGVRVVQVGGPLPAGEHAGTATETSADSARAMVSIPQPGAAATYAGPSSVGATASRSHGGWWTVSRVSSSPSAADSAWMPAAAPSRPSDGRAGTTGSSGTATATGKFTSRDPRPAINGAHHLTWPVVLDGTGPVSYVLSNPFGRAVSTLWHGYDSTGALVAVQEIVLDPSSGLAVSAGRPLVTLEEGGHWETFSDSLLYYGESSGVQPAAVAAVESDSLPVSWEFETGPIGANGRLWLANPTESTANIVIAVSAADQVFFVQHIAIGPHSVAILALQDIVASHPEFAASLVAGVVDVAATDGSVAVGIVPTPDGASRRGKPGEWVY